MRKLIKEFGSEEAVWKLKDNQINCIVYLTDRQKQAFIYQKRSLNPDYLLEYTLSKNIKLVSYGDSDYPEKLNNIPSPPSYLFFRGKLPNKNLSSVAIIGARMCSEYGKEAARVFSKELAKEGVQIISGLASGIDGISQRAALDVNGESFGILGSGIDVCYPVSNKKLYNDLIDKCGLISENPLKSKPMPYHFPMRNRIISGLADIVLVVEAKEKSGTLITVDFALEQGRDVFVVPGNINSINSVGTNELIKQGAKLVTTYKDIDI